MAKDFPLKSEGFHPFGDLIGLNFSKCENGYSECSLVVNEKLLNPHGVVHGGVIYSMADTGMGGALYSVLEDDESCATIEIKINYFTPVKSGVLVCRTRVIHKSKRIAVMESEISCGNSLIAKAIGTYSIFKIKRN
jgi:acyl-CoA thioesterase